jgi:hypothetical protein
VAAAVGGAAALVDVRAAAAIPSDVACSLRDEAAPAVRRGQDRQQQHGDDSPRYPRHSFHDPPHVSSQGDASWRRPSRRSGESPVAGRCQAPSKSRARGGRLTPSGSPAEVCICRPRLPAGRPRLGAKPARHRDGARQPRCGRFTGCPFRMKYLADMGLASTSRWHLGPVAVSQVGMRRMRHVETTCRDRELRSRTSRREALSTATRRGGTGVRNPRRGRGDARGSLGRARADPADELQPVGRVAPSSKAA